MILFHIIFFTIFIFTIVSLVLTLKGFFEKEKEFVNYLYAIKDMKTLYSLGIINEFGTRERRRTKFYEVESYLLKKFNLTKDDKYMEYFNIHVAYRGKIIARFVLLFIIQALFFLIRGILYS